MKSASEKIMFEKMFSSFLQFLAVSLMAKLYEVNKNIVSLKNEKRLTASGNAFAFGAGGLRFKSRVY